MPKLAANVRFVSEQICEVRHNSPHAIALSYGDRHLSYAELDRRAGRFAGYLANCGTVPGGTVAICMERSFDWIVAALGVMRAGAAYVPLDSAWPDSRLRFAVKDSGATGVVANAALLDRLRVKARGIDPRRDATDIAATPELEPRPTKPASLAYLIYTSGSTGVPKGVEITHANLSHLVRWHLDAFGVTRRDRASHIAGLGFDAAVWEIWPNLAAGATLCLADDVVRSSPDLLQQWIVRERLTIAFVPTVYATPMMKTEWPATTVLRLLLTGGEVLQCAPAIQLPFKVVNNYGPTECTVVATSAVLRPGSQGAPTIGRPITGSVVYLLDEHGEPVPDGSSGEIYIGGDGVGRGYHNLPDTTERSFLHDPFAGTPDARMYRTGDTGVRRPDGDIEFHGRLDRQTKIRGQRVELDEIASVLTRHPSVDFATAIANVVEGREKQLVAYILPKENANLPTARELQKYLLRSLPDYMIPDTFVRLRSLPISPNGKLDLAMLAQYTDAQHLEQIPSEVPVTPIEKKLLTLVRELLKNDAVAAEDSFFLAGGHSLLGTQLLLRLRSEYGVDLTLRQLFESPTVERLALFVETMLEEERLAAGLTDSQPAEHTQRTARAMPSMPPGVLALQPYGAGKGIFWAHHLTISLATAIGDGQPFFSVVLTAEESASLGETPTLRSVAECLVRKILAAQPKGPYTIGGFCLGGILACEIASQLRAAGREVSLVVLLDPLNPSYASSCDSLTEKLSYVGYIGKRVARLGIGPSLVYLREHLLRRFVRLAGLKSARTEIRVVQETVEAAARGYRPEKYEGKVLLLLASERPPHVNPLPGWQALFPGDLHAQYVDGHHRDLLTTKCVRIVADAIISQLTPVDDDEPLSLCADSPEPKSRAQTGDTTGG
jgi:amino acid adenylation domain-containing protein